MSKVSGSDFESKMGGVMTLKQLRYIFTHYCHSRRQSRVVVSLSDSLYSQRAQTAGKLKSMKKAAFVQFGVQAPNLMDHRIAKSDLELIFMDSMSFKATQDQKYELLFEDWLVALVELANRRFSTSPQSMRVRLLAQECLSPLYDKLFHPTEGDDDGASIADSAMLGSSSASNSSRRRSMMRTMGSARSGVLSAPPGGFGAISEAVGEEGEDSDSNYSEPGQLFTSSPLGQSRGTPANSRPLGGGRRKSAMVPNANPFLPLPTPKTAPPPPVSKRSPTTNFSSEVHTRQHAPNGSSASSQQPVAGIGSNGRESSRDGNSPRALDRQLTLDEQNKLLEQLQQLLDVVGELKAENQELRQALAGQI